MFCLKCGKVIEDNAVFCPFCGGKQPKASWLDARKASLTAEEPSMDTQDNAPDPGLAQSSAVEASSLPESDSGVKNRPPEQERLWIAKDPVIEEERRVQSAGLERWIEAGAGIVGLILLMPFSLKFLSLPLDLLSQFMPGNMSFGGVNPFGSILSLLNGALRVFRVMSLVVILIFSLILFFALIFTIIRHGKTDVDGKKRGLIMPIIAMIVSLLVFLSALFALINILPVTRTLLMLIALIFGLDLAVRVFVLNTALNGSLHPLRDIRAMQVASIYNGPPSEFDGKTVELFGRFLLYAVLALITCGIAIPWLEVSFLKWKTSHTVIDGKRLSFNGTGSQLFIRRIKWTFLTTATLSAYGLLFVKNAYLSWMLSHTTYEGNETEADLLNSGIYQNSSFTGTGPDDFGQHTFLTLFPWATGIFAIFVAPFTYKAYHKWEKRNMIVRGDRYTFDGGAIGLLGNNLLCFLVNLIPLLVSGLLALLLTVAGSGLGVMVAVMSIVGILCSLGFLFTFAWSCCRIYRYLTSHTHVDAGSL